MSNLCHSSFFLLSFLSFLQLLSGVFFFFNFFPLSFTFFQLLFFIEKKKVFLLLSFTFLHLFYVQYYFLFISFSLVFLLLHMAFTHFLQLLSSISTGFAIRSYCAFVNQLVSIATRLNPDRTTILLLNSFLKCSH